MKRVVDSLLSLKQHASWGRLAQLLVCLAGGVVAWSLFAEGIAGLNRSGLIQPMVLAGRFLTFVLASCAFWHGGLWWLIAAPKSMPLKSVFTRVLDYFWYGAAVLSAALIINEFQLSQLQQWKEFSKSSIDFNYERMESSRPENLVEACSSLADLNEQDEIRFYIQKPVIAELCAAKLPPQGGDRAFAEKCEAAYLVSHDNDVRFVSASNPDLKAAALNKLQSICTAHSDYFEERQRQREIDAAIAAVSSVPEQKSQRWLYILAVVIGLRLTRTTAETIDAWRDWKATNKSRDFM